MSELATMAALKITNSINQHYSQQNLDSLITVNQSNMPFLAQSPQSDSSSATTATNTTTNNLTVTSNTNTTTNNTNNSIYTNPDSPDAHSLATDATLSRQTSIDATQSSLHDCTLEDSNQTLSGRMFRHLYHLLE